MKETIPQKRPFRKSFLANLILVALICVALYWLFFVLLGWITGHGDEKIVPTLTGKSLKESLQILNNQNFEVQIDSTYDPSKRGLIVIQQQPEAGMTVKEGRTIFIVVNKVSPPQTPMPNLINLSFRSAELLLQSNKLVLGDTTYKPDIADGSVLAQQWPNGKDIKPGTMLPQGTKINLIIGDGLGNNEIPVPDVVGMTYPEAIAMISGNNLQYTVVADGRVNDTNSAYISSQMPAAKDDLGAPVKILEGDVIDLRIQQDMPQTPNSNP